ncbi:MAG: cytochrome c biogenesis protein CcsA [SAR324 cluster bacterium]|uniref:Cytochrome c biogenesis protein CcsA n=1 Tax=SAR324 cluster bacterium TaxID=2024889 RepID=A0A7X9FQ30_9DELT|nr:cytochrome c biogenesis protein CcsA [SAR324 cluster bacterium]
MDSNIGFNFRSFGGLPVLHKGRVKPLDTIARVSLLMLSGKQNVRLNGRKVSAIEWFLDVLFDSKRSDNYSIFQIDDPDVLGVLGLQQTEDRLYPFKTLEPHLGEIEVQAKRAEEIQASERTRFQMSIRKLFQRIVLYNKLQNTIHIAGDENLEEDVKDFEKRLQGLKEKHKSGIIIDDNDPSLLSIVRFLEKYRSVHELSEFQPICLTTGANMDLSWIDIGEAMVAKLQSNTIQSSAVAYMKMADAYRLGDTALFNDIVNKLAVDLGKRIPAIVRITSLEQVFNYSQLFLKSCVLYVLVFILAFVSWIIWPQFLNKCAFSLLIIAFLIHSFGLVTRMLIQGRPPVTNLYSSAVFVGWGSVLLGIIVEHLFKKGLGNIVAGAIGFITLLIAHNLAAEGDTIEIMRAVLDSNFWLTTHVITITIGYSSTLFAGLIAIVFIFRRCLDRSFLCQDWKLFSRVVHGLICFSLFFSFLGTVLGGIWADQSWGRFWGWDPKENGALLVILWNAFILHSWLGKIKDLTAVMQMTVFGNVITILSWFGVNMLGIGLHTYGAMDHALMWLGVFVLSQLLVITLGFVPARIERISPKP